MKLPTQIYIVNSALNRPILSSAESDLWRLVKQTLKTHVTWIVMRLCVIASRQKKKHALILRVSLFLEQSKQAW